MANNKKIYFNEGDLSFITIDEHQKDIHLFGNSMKYIVTDSGKIFSYKRKGINNPITNHELCHSIDSNGYHQITLCYNGCEKRFMLHRIVALAFIKNTYNKPEVNHIDGNKNHNYISNLEWNTRKENINHAFETGLISTNFTKENKDKLVKLLRENKLTISKISEITGFNKDTIRHIIKGTYRDKYFKSIGPIHEYTINNRISYSHDDEKNIRDMINKGIKLTKISEITGIKYGCIKYLKKKMEENQTMANNRCTFQQVETLSVKRDKITDIATNLDWSKTDLRVFLALLTQLEGYSVPKTMHSSHKDPLNFKIIDIEAMADLLSLSKKKVKKSINYLHEEGIIEEGGNDTIKSGYRFTF